MHTYNELLPYNSKSAWDPGRHPFVFFPHKKKTTCLVCLVTPHFLTDETLAPCQFPCTHCADAYWKKIIIEKPAHTFTQHLMSCEVFNCVEEKGRMVWRRAVISVGVSKEGQFVDEGSNFRLASKGKWAAHHISNYCCQYCSCKCWLRPQALFILLFSPLYSKVSGRIICSIFITEIPIYLHVVTLEKNEKVLVFIYCYCWKT